MKSVRKVCLLGLVGVMMAGQVMAADVDAVSFPFASLISESVEPTRLAAEVDAVNLNFVALIDERADYHATLVQEVDRVDMNFAALIDEKPAAFAPHLMVADSVVDF